MKKVEKILSVFMATSITMSTALSNYAYAGLQRDLASNNDQSVRSDRSSRQLKKAMDDSNEIMLQLLISASLAKTKGADLTLVDEDTVSKYNTIRNSYFGSVPMSIVGGAFSGYFGPQVLKLSAEAAGPLLRLIQPALVALKKSAEYGSEKSGDLITFLKIDKIIEKSYDAAEKSSTKIWRSSLKPLLGSLLTRGAATLSGSIASGALLYGSIFFISNDANEAMVNPAVRTLLGQDEVIRNRIKSLVDNVAGIINLNESSKARLEIAIYDSIIKQAVKNEFSEDASKYSLDILQLLEENKLIDSSLSAAVKNISALSEATDLRSSGSPEALEIISSNIDLTLALAMTLQSNLNAGKITDLQTKAELQRMLGALDAQLDLLDFNINK